MNVGVQVSDNEDKAWQLEFRQLIRSVADLLDTVELTYDERILKDKKILADFPLRVTKTFVDSIKKNDWKDPLLRQILPFQGEVIEHPDFIFDPLGERQSNHTPGILHKYHGRALMIINGACAVHCRYCFRRHFPYERQKSRDDAKIEYLRANPDISEVILSGGDPLLMTDNALTALLFQLESMPHIKTLRIHSRLPIVLPNRFTRALCQTLNNSRLKIVLVIHSNHANELSEKVINALKKVKPCVNALLNQSVLLAGINDDAQSLANLSRTLFESGVLPYYLHMPDLVSGTTHFHVTEKHGTDLIERISKVLPGYLVPKLVKEIAGEPYKTRVA